MMQLGMIDLSWTSLSFLLLGFVLGFMFAVYIARSMHDALHEENAKLRRKLRDTTDALHESYRLLRGVCDRRM